MYVDVGIGMKVFWRAWLNDGDDTVLTETCQPLATWLDTTKRLCLVRCKYIDINSRILYPGQKGIKSKRFLNSR